MTSEWLQIRHKTQVSDTFEVGKLYFKIDGYLPDFRDSVIFPYISLYTQAVAYTTYVQSAARRALKNQKHIKKTTFELAKPVTRLADARKLLQGEFSLQMNFRF